MGDKTKQYMLQTLHIEEASIKGNSEVVQEWFKQLKMDTQKEQQTTAEKRVIVWIGDQLTVSRLRALFQRRSKDRNSFDRMDWGVFIFG